jgi:hypothetical protein
VPNVISNAPVVPVVSLIPEGTIGTIQFAGTAFDFGAMLALAAAFSLLFDFLSEIYSRIRKITMRLPTKIDQRYRCLTCGLADPLCQRCRGTGKYQPVGHVTILSDTDAKKMAEQALAIPKTSQNKR